jgi:hypothetical protein
LTLHQLHTEETTEAKSSCNLGKKGPHRSANKEMLENRSADILATWRRLQILKLGHHKLGQRVYKCISCHILSISMSLHICVLHRFSYVPNPGSKHGRSQTLRLSELPSCAVTIRCIQLPLRKALNAPPCCNLWTLAAAGSCSAFLLIQFIQALSVTK